MRVLLIIFVFGFVYAEDTEPQKELTIFELHKLFADTARESTFNLERMRTKFVNTIVTNITKVIMDGITVCVSTTDVPQPDTFCVWWERTIIKDVICKRIREERIAKMPIGLGINYQYEGICFSIR